MYVVLLYIVLGGSGRIGVVAEVYYRNHRLDVSLSGWGAVCSTA